MMRRIAGLFLVFAACTPTFAGPKEDALAAYQKFFEAFTTDNHDQLAALFAPDALFYGTGSSEVVITPEGIREYFVGALTASGARPRQRHLRKPRWSCQTRLWPYRGSGSQSEPWMEKWSQRVHREIPS